MHTYKQVQVCISAKWSKVFPYIQAQSIVDTIQYTVYT